MVAALIAAFAGHWGRSRLAGRFGTDLPGALIEDGVVQSLAWVACLGRAPNPLPSGRESSVGALWEKAPTRASDSA